MDNPVDSPSIILPDNSSVPITDNPPPISNLPPPPPPEPPIVPQEIPAEKPISEPLLTPSFTPPPLPDVKPEETVVFNKSNEPPSGSKPKKPFLIGGAILVFLLAVTAAAGYFVQVGRFGVQKKAAECPPGEQWSFCGEQCKPKSDCCCDPGNGGGGCVGDGCAWGSRHMCNSNPTELCCDGKTYDGGHCHCACGGGGGGTCSGVHYHLPSTIIPGQPFGVEIDRIGASNCNGNWDNVWIKLDGTPDIGVSLGKLDGSNPDGQAWYHNSNVTVSAGTHTIQLTINNGTCTSCNSQDFTVASPPTNTPVPTATPTRTSPTATPTVPAPTPTRVATATPTVPAPTATPTQPQLCTTIEILKRVGSNFVPTTASALVIGDVIKVKVNYSGTVQDVGVIIVYNGTTTALNESNGTAPTGGSWITTTPYTISAGTYEILGFIKVGGVWR